MIRQAGNLPLGCLLGVGGYRHAPGAVEELLARILVAEHPEKREEDLDLQLSVVLLVLVQLVQPLDDRRRRDELHRAAVRKQLPHENHHLAHQLKGLV